MHETKWGPFLRTGPLILTHLDRTCSRLSQVNQLGAPEHLSQGDMVLLKEQSWDYVPGPETKQKDNVGTGSTFTPRGRRTPVS